MRIRYEDFALNPIGNTLKMYDFIGINMTMEVKEWLDKATSIANKNDLSVASPQGLRRNVKTVLNSWRKELPFTAVQIIQNKCKSILDILNYKKFDSNEEMKKLSVSYFTPNWY